MNSIRFLTLAAATAFSPTVHGAVIYDSLSSGTAGGAALMEVIWGRSVSSSFVVPTDSDYLLTSVALGLVVNPGWSSSGEPRPLVPQSIVISVSPESATPTAPPFGSSITALYDDEVVSGNTLFLADESVILSAGATYWITVGRISFEGFITWTGGISSSGEASPSIGTTAGSGGWYPSRGGGTSWLYNDVVPAMQINATPIPEPSCFTSLLLGLVGLIYHRKR